MSPLVSMINLRFAPHALLLLLLGANVWIFIAMTTVSQEALWTGPPMPGKRLALADPGQAKVAATPPAAAQEKKSPEESAAVSKPKPVEKPPTGRGEYIVQVGGFFQELGANAMVERLRKGGFEPWVETTQEVVRLNDVQAGPFASPKDAKEAEAQLKAIGIVAKTEETWEGFVISLSRSFNLGEAMQEMEKAQELGIRSVRLVKVDEERSVRRVCVGPYSNKEKAKEVSAKIAKIGLTVPVIKERIPQGRSRKGAASQP
ncbi:MAG: SPOR domain-containing protein [Magnetococcales bacterium]|nr:SPOR domain-containing protein [Magnetococcales bacterium]